MSAENSMKTVFLPVIVGNAFSSWLCAYKLYFKYGLFSHICSYRRSLLGTPDFSEYHKIYKKSDDGTLLDMLCDIGDDSQGRDYIQVLIVKGNAMREKIMKMREELEKRYVIFPCAYLESLGFGEKIKL